MKNHYRINIKSKNASLTLAPYSPCRVIDGGLRGFDFSDISLQVSNNAFSAGGVVTSTSFPPRTLSVKFDVRELDKYPSVRNTALKLMNPAERVNITTYLYGRRRQISAVPAKAEFLHDNLNDVPTVTLTFISDGVFFTEGGEKTYNLPIATPFVNGPVTLMKPHGFTPSIAPDDYYKIYNPGDVRCGFVLSARAVETDIVQPYITLGGKTLQYMGTLKTGDTITFDTRVGSKRITVNDTITYNYSMTSKFPELEAGENKLYVRSSSSYRGLDCSISFSPLYLGA